MKFINRLKFFSFGFIIGLILLMFFLSGKKTSCSYFPDARVKKRHIKKKNDFQQSQFKKGFINYN